MPTSPPLPPLPVLDAPPPPRVPIRLRAYRDDVPRGAMLRLYRAAGGAAEARGDVDRVEGELLATGPADRLEVDLRDGPAGRTAHVAVALERVARTPADELEAVLAEALAGARVRSGGRPPARVSDPRRRRPGSVVLLENPYRDPDRPDEPRSDLACGTFLLASALRAGGVPCALVPGTLDPRSGLDDPAALWDALSGADLLGLTVLEACLAEHRALTDEVATRSKTWIAVGGPLPTWTPAHALAQLPAAHVAVRGPGETTLPALARLLRRDRLDAAAQEAVLALDGVLLHRGRLLLAGHAGVVPDPDPDASPMDFGLLRRRHVRHGLSLETARGCQHPCLFCTTPGKGRHRGRSAAVVARHLRAYRRRLDDLFDGTPPPVTRRVQICDDDFPCDPDRAVAVLAAVRGSGLQLAAFQASVRDFVDRRGGRSALRAALLDAVDPALFQDATAHAQARRGAPRARPPDHTGVFVHLGVESLADPDLRRLGKGYRAADVEAVVGALDRRGVVHDAYLILANRGTTLDDLVDTVAALPRLKLLHPHTFYVRTPPVPFVVPTFASGSYRAWHRAARRGGAEGEVRLDAVHRLAGYPEWDYPLVAGERPDDPDVRAAAAAWEDWFELDGRHEAPARNLAAWLTGRLADAHADPDRAARLRRAIRRLRGLGEREALRAVARARRGELHGATEERAYAAAAALGPAEQVAVRARNALEAGDPRMVVIPTRDCSLRCTYCPAVKRGGHEMSRETLRGAVELLLSGDGPAAILQFFGGEALLRRAFVLEAIDLALARAAAAGKRVGFIVSTNGMDVDEALLHHFAALPLKVEISLDGPREVQMRHRRPRDRGRDSYDAVAGVAPALIASGIPHDVIMVVTPETVDRLADSFAHVVSLGFRRVQVNHALDVRWDRAAKQAFAAQLQAIADRFFADGPGEVEWVDLRAWRHPMLLNGEVTVDVDGTIYYGNGFLVRHADPAAFRAGHLDDLDPLDLYLLRKPDNETLLRHTYPAAITANNVEVGRIYGSFVRHMRRRFPALAEPRPTRTPER